MIRKPRIFRHDVDDSDLEKVAIKTINYYHEMIRQIASGRKPDRLFAQNCLFILEECVKEIWLSPEMQLKVKPYNELFDNYLYHAFNPVLGHTSKSKENLNYKKQEIIVIVILFDFYIQNYARTKVKLSSIRSNFIQDLADWYRDSEHKPINLSSVYEYIGESNLGIEIDKETYGDEIRFRKWILDDFFQRNKAENFPDEFPDVKRTFIEFHDFVQKIIKK